MVTSGMLLVRAFIGVDQSEAKLRCQRRNCPLSAGWVSAKKARMNEPKSHAETPTELVSRLPIQDIAAIGAAVQPIFQSLADAQKAQADAQKVQAQSQAEVQMHAEGE